MIKLGPLEFLRSRKDAERKLRMTVPSETGNIRKVSARILSNLTPYRLDEATIFDIKLCIEEAVRNAIVHGNRADKRRSVTVTFWVEGGALMIEIADEGSGFDQSTLADPTSALHILKNSGRGVYLIKKLMDRVEYTDNGTRVLMVKKLQQ